MMKMLLKFYDKNIKDYRNVEYKDIVILLRATSNWAPSFLEQLKLENIPVYARYWNRIF